MNLDREPMMERSYRIPMELFKKAFIAFQKKFVYPRNWLLTAVLGSVAIVYIDSVTQNPSNYMAYLLLAVCVGMIVILWFNPKKVRRSLFESLKELENDVYHVRFYEDGMTIVTEEINASEAAPDSVPEDAAQTPVEETAGLETEIVSQDEFQPVSEEIAAAEEAPVDIEPTVIPFHKDVKVLEYGEFFMVYLVKQMFYIIPKSEFTEDELIRLRCLFTDSLAERFHPATH